MPSKPLSPREEEIIGLCVEGLTNEAIAHKLGISIGTVNTYWLRIKLKVGGLGRTDTVVRVVKEQAHKDLQASKLNLAEQLLDRGHSELEARAALALFHFAMDQISSTVWATDRDLVIHILANGENPSTHTGVDWALCKSVFEMFNTVDPTDTAVAAHLGALSGVESEVMLTGEFANMHLRVIPLDDESEEIIGCISVLNVPEPAVAEDSTTHSTKPEKNGTKGSISAPK